MFGRRTGYAMVLAFAVAAAGCASSFELKNPMPKKAESAARLAAYEAAADYPRAAAAAAAAAAGATTRAGRDIAVTAGIDRDARIVRLANPSDIAYHGVRVWLDGGRYVAWLNELPPRRVVHVSQAVFADADRKPPATLASVKLVEIQTGGELYRALGPALEPSESDRPNGRGIELSFPPKFGDKK